MVKQAAARLTTSSREPDARGKAPLRRRVPRVATGAWPGRYVDDQDPGSGPRECFVIDISLLGVGLEVLGHVGEDAVGHRVQVHVQAPVGDSVSLRLVGRVRNVSQGRHSTTRAGLEFEGLSETERDILKVLELLQVAW